ncbi:hypothetical protein [Paludisphaera borealis]|uniref:Uncharacterized protein n=1 Tax=Paludisphaera borealis TaxID=1387353 RepID=A0A1U7CQC8_9BACT|nr:hypothetical protein [Paludisphaera borealis]APW61137.1 hypothetical protein BSF38_02641 [Paludisphaera borealis]
MTPPLLDAGRRSPARVVEIEVPEEPPSFACNLAAAIFSFVLLAVVDVFSSQFLMVLFTAFEDACLLILEFLPYGPIVDAALGAIVLTLIAVALQLFQRYWRFPSWLPLALAWPTAWMLVAPSALEHGDWASWLILGTLGAGVFCSHWLCILLAQEAWD